MPKSPKFLSVVLTLALFAGSGLALADPGNGKGQGNGKGNGQGGHGKDHSKGKGGAGHGPSVDRASVLSVLGGSRDYWSPRSALPPGIQKNLARGKPLPPGIAKQIDPALARQLPYYPGYEWRQYGTDAVLVEVGTTVVREVLRDILR